MIEKAARMAGAWWGERLLQGDKKRFSEEVEKRVLAELKEHGRSHLECDYDPFGILLEAVHAIGIECRGFMFSAQGILPKKHSLTVYPEHLIPKEGYGNWTKEIEVN
jgi:hypothetical protein